MCKVYTGYHGTSEIEHGLCACTVDNSLAKARGLSLRTGGQTMLYLSHMDIHVALLTLKAPNMKTFVFAYTAQIWIWRVVTFFEILQM